MNATPTRSAIVPEVLGGAGAGIGRVDTGGERSPALGVATPAVMLHSRGSTQRSRTAGRDGRGRSDRVVHHPGSHRPHRTDGLGRTAGELDHRGQPGRRGDRGRRWTANERRATSVDRCTASRSSSRTWSRRRTGWRRPRVRSHWSARSCPRDAGVAARLREAGAILLGKANMSEWNAFRGWPDRGGWSGRAGIGRNPYALSFSTGDSSSGSAAAVAASFAAGAVGLETYGSIVMPSSLCGVVGLKPTSGLVGRSGTIPISFTRDVIGPIARTVADVAMLLGGMVGVDPFDPQTGR